VLPLYHRVYRFHIYVYFPLQNSMYQNLNQIFNILNSENLIYSLYVCTSIFLLCQESFHMILDNNLLFYDGGVTTSSVSLTKDKSHKNFLLIHYKKQRGLDVINFFHHVNLLHRYLHPPFLLLFLLFYSSATYTHLSRLGNR
jgi:hypothetical protein